MTPEEIRTLRESLGLSQSEFVAELGLKCDRETAENAQRKGCEMSRLFDALADPLPKRLAAVRLRRRLAQEFLDLYFQVKRAKNPANHAINLQLGQ